MTLRSVPETIKSLAIVSACCLRTVKPTLTGICSRRLNIRHGDAPLFGKAISLSVYRSERGTLNASTVENPIWSYRQSALLGRPPR
jgi:hypothetical protein